jgi:hypothetical protein
MLKVMKALKRQTSEQPLTVVLCVVLMFNVGAMVHMSATLQRANAGMAVFDAAGLAQAIKEMGVSKEVLDTAKSTWETTQEMLSRTEDVLQATGYGETLSPSMITMFGAEATGDSPLSGIIEDGESTMFNFDDMMKLTNVGLSIVERGGLENVTLADGMGIYDTMFGSYVKDAQKDQVAFEYGEATTREALESNWQMVEDLPAITKQIANLSATAQQLAGAKGSSRAQIAVSTLATLQNSALLSKILQQRAVNDTQRIAREQQTKAENGTWANPDAKKTSPVEVEGTPWLKEGSAPAAGTAAGNGNPASTQGQGSGTWNNPDDVRTALGG